MRFCFLKPYSNDGSADSLRAKLNAIVLENRGIDDLEEDVKRICREHGVGLSVARSLRTPDKTRRAMLVLKCRHGVANRQAYWQSLQGNGEINCPSCVAQEATRWSSKILGKNTCPR